MSVPGWVGQHGGETALSNHFLPLLHLEVLRDICQNVEQTLRNFPI